MRASARREQTNNLKGTDMFEPELEVITKRAAAGELSRAELYAKLKYIAKKQCQRGQSIEQSFVELITKDPDGKAAFALYQKMRGPSRLPAPTPISFKKNSDEGERSEWLKLVNAYQAEHKCGHAEAVNAVANTKEGKAAIAAERVQKLGRSTSYEPAPGKPAPGNSFTRPLPQTFPANAALRAAILEHVAEHPELSIPQATASLLETPEGAKLNRAATYERLYGERILASAG